MNPLFPTSPQAFVVWAPLQIRVTAFYGFYGRVVRASRCASSLRRVTRSCDMTEPIDTGALIRRIGALLWGPGPGWPAAMSEALGINIRTVRRWSSLQQIPPDAVLERLRERLAAHRDDCADVEDAIAEYLNRSQE